MVPKMDNMCSNKYLFKKKTINQIQVLVVVIAHFLRETKYIPVWIAIYLLLEKYSVLGLKAVTMWKQLPPTNEVCEVYVSQVSVCPQGGPTPLHAVIADNPPWAHPLLGTPPPPDRYPPPGRHLPAQCMLANSQCWQTVNKRAVRIPLECIFFFFSLNCGIDMHFQLCYEEKIVLHCLNSSLVWQIWWGFT